MTHGFSECLTTSSTVADHFAILELASYSASGISFVTGTAIDDEGREQTQAFFAREALPVISARPDLWPAPWNSVSRFAQVAGVVQSRAFHMEESNWVTGSAKVRVSDWWVGGWDTGWVSGRGIFRRNSGRNGRKMAFSESQSRQRKSTIADIAQMAKNMRILGAQNILSCNIFPAWRTSRFSDLMLAGLHKVDPVQEKLLVERFVIRVVVLEKKAEGHGDFASLPVLWFSGAALQVSCAATDPR